MMSPMVIIIIEQLKSFSDNSDKKRTFEFVCEIRVMIDNDPRKSIRSIVRGMRDS